MRGEWSHLLLGQLSSDSANHGSCDISGVADQVRTSFGPGCCAMFEGTMSQVNEKQGILRYEPPSSGTWRPTLDTEVRVAMRQLQKMSRCEQTEALGHLLWCKIAKGPHSRHAGEIVVDLLRRYSTKNVSF